jgi:hypothetical protein
MVAGLAFDRLGAGVPFVIAAVVVASTLALGLDLESYVPRKARVAPGRGGVAAPARPPARRRGAPRGLMPGGRSG